MPQAPAMEVSTETATTTSTRAREHRPLRGLPRRPGWMAAAFFRLPLKAYQHNAGPRGKNIYLTRTSTDQFVRAAAAPRPAG